MMPGKHCTGGWKRLSLSSPLSDFETPELNVCCFLANIPGSLQRQQTINAGYAEDDKYDDDDKKEGDKKDDKKDKGKIVVCCKGSKQFMLAFWFLPCSKFRSSSSFLIL